MLFYCVYRWCLDFQNLQQLRFLQITIFLTSLSLYICPLLSKIFSLISILPLLLLLTSSFNLLRPLPTPLTSPLRSSIKKRECHFFEYISLASIANDWQWYFLFKWTAQKDLFSSSKSCVAAITSAKAEKKVEPGNVLYKRGGSVAEHLRSLRSDDPLSKGICIFYSLIYI